MAQPREANWVAELSSSTGTGSMTLSGAVAGHQTWLAGFGATNTEVYYGIRHDGSTAWEVGIGTFLSGSNALQRDTVLASSSGGSKVSFASGDKVVYCQHPAEVSQQVRIRRSTDIGLEVIGAASQSANPISVKTSAAAEVFNVGPSGRVLATGLSFGSATAPGGVHDLSRHIALYSTTYGFNVTSSTLNYKSGANHDFYVGSTLVAEITSAGINASLRHKDYGGYFRIGSYSLATYGTGNARFYYDAVNRRLVGASDNSGSVSQLNVDLGSIRLQSTSPQVVFNETDSNRFYRLIGRGTGHFYLEVDTNLAFSSPTVIFRARSDNGEIDFYNNGNNVARILAGGSSTDTSVAVMTREKGDARYQLSVSSEEYKQEIEALGSIDTTGLVPRRWVWDMDGHPRNGMSGAGFIYEEVATAFPEAAYPTGGIDTNALLAVFVGSTRAALAAIDARLNALEAT